MSKSEHNTGSVPAERNYAEVAKRLVPGCLPPA